MATKRKSKAPTLEEMSELKFVSVSSELDAKKNDWVYTVIVAEPFKGNNAIVSFTAANEQHAERLAAELEKAGCKRIGERYA